jgi:hypothetical protein
MPVMASGNETSPKVLAKYANRRFIAKEKQHTKAATVLDVYETCRSVENINRELLLHNIKCCSFIVGVSLKNPFGTHPFRP